MKQWIIWLLLAASLSGRAWASDDMLWSELDLDELDRAGQSYVEDVDLSQTTSLEQGVAFVLEKGAAALPAVFRQSVRSALILLVIVLLCAMADNVQAAGKPDALQIVVIAGALAITAASASDMDSMMGLGRSTIQNMDGFAQTLLPAMAAVSAAAGGAAGAAARQIATAAFSGLLLSLIDTLLVPLVYAYVAACTAYAAVGNPGLKKLADLLKWVVTNALTVLLIAYVTYLTVSGVLAGSTDAAALKATKMVLSNAVPVVGKIISDAAETVLVGAGLLKNTVGLFGMVVVLGICIVPFLQLGVHYLTYKLTAALAGTIAHSRLAQLIEGIGTAFGLILGMSGACALLLLVSMASGLGGSAA